MSGSTLGGRLRRRVDELFGSPATALAFGAVLLFPWLPAVSYSVLGTANLAAYYAMTAVSLVVLTGWVGQISLGHAAFVGIGAYSAGFVISVLDITFPMSLVWAGAASAVVAMVLGVVALRIRGLYLAVATLIFSWMASEFLFQQAWFTKYASVTVRPFGEPGTIPFLDWTSRRTFFYVAWAVVAGAIYVAANLRDSKTGRAFFAVRGSEVAAASLGISVVRTKLVAFAVSGALAGMSGNLLIVRDQIVTPDAFQVTVSLFFLAIAVVGGLSSLGGAVAGSVLFATLNELFFRFTAFAGWLEVVPPLLLTVVLLLYRGGLAAVPDAMMGRLGPRLGPLLARAQRQAASARQRLAARARPATHAAPRPVGRLAAVVSQVSGRLAARMPTRLPGAFARLRAKRVVPTRSRVDLSALAGQQSTAPTRVGSANGNAAAVHAEVAEVLPSWRSVAVRPVVLPSWREARPIVAAADHVTVRFGGLVAVNDVSLEVRKNEIVGLIGPNGAGKTTLFNSLAGLNVPTSGRVVIHDCDVTDWTVDERARLGVGRTFQAVQLLPQLSVFDNLLVATHVHNESRLLSHALAGPKTIDAERRARQDVRQVAALLELEPYLERRAADLPFGVLRMVELGRALVTGAELMMLDEPASGLDDRETEQFAEILRFVRDLGVTLLLIEHDVHMVTSVSDYLYVLDQGRLLAEGLPADVQRDERVIAAYLGAPPADEPLVVNVMEAP